MPREAVELMASNTRWLKLEPTSVETADKLERHLVGAVDGPVVLDYDDVCTLYKLIDEMTDPRCRWRWWAIPMLHELREHGWPLAA